MTHQLDDLAELREDADVLLQQAESARAAVGTVRAGDSSGQVRVHLDDAGELEAVHVGFTWDRTLSPDQLPAAVLEALGNARAARFEQWGDGYRRQQDEPSPRARPGEADHVVGHLREQVEARGGTPEAAGQLLEEMLAEVASGLGEANRLLDEHAGRQFSGRSGNGRVTALVAGNGDLVSVEYDARWLPGAHPTNIGRETTQAVRAAVRISRERGLAAAVQAGRLGRLARGLVGATNTTAVDTSGGTDS